MQTYIVPVDEEGQCVLPLALRERLGVPSGGQIELISDEQGVLLRVKQNDTPPPDAPFSSAPSAGLQESKSTRQVGMDKAESRISRAGPGVKLTRIGRAPEASSGAVSLTARLASSLNVPEGGTDPASGEDANPFLRFLGAAPLPEGVTTEDFMRETRGDPDPAIDRLLTEEAPDR
ncbi:AbrB/MazE/SpoVT family DNA-binding domain-containing protein [Deinococcus altitudinis]|uniref:AbrB/MazE/SpoVT family DNA-binding domain-containing protein n=1 Tax=Deinococcus altitudinis TaxID=468914 RepID=UPI0038923EC2